MRDNPSQDHLDETIDDVARSMTDGMPAGSLRDGVMARIAGIASDAARTSGAWAWRLGLAAPAIAVIVLVIARNVSDPLPEAGTRQLARDIELRARTDGARVEVADGNAPLRIAASEPRRADSARTGSTSTRGFQTAPPDEPPEQLPFPTMELETVAIEPLIADAVMLEEIELPMQLQVQRLNIDPVVLE